MAQWIDVCAASDVEIEDLIRFDHGGRAFAIYRSPDDEYFCSDGLCTHEKVNLGEGLVIDYTIECPKHNGHFDYRTGEALRMPVEEIFVRTVRSHQAAVAEAARMTA